MALTHSPPSLQLTSHIRYTPFDQELSLRPRFGIPIIIVREPEAKRPLSPPTMVLPTETVGVLALLTFLSSADAFLPGSRPLLVNNHLSLTDRSWRRPRNRLPQPASAATSLPPLPSMMSSRDDLLGGYSAFDDDNNGRLLPIGGGGFDTGREDDSLLSYLRVPPESLPPRTKKLIKLATENYVYGTTTTTTRKNDHDGDLFQEALDVVEEEYRAFDVPILLDGNVTIDVTKTGDEIDESIAEVLSLAALYRLPKEITLELLGTNASTSETTPTETATEYNKGRNNATDAVASDKSRASFDVCRVVFQEKGWEAVSFPKGLAIQLKRKFITASGDGAAPTASSNRFMSMLRRKKRRIEVAQVAVEEAKIAEPPERRQRQTREEFLATIEEQFGSSAALSLGGGSSGGGIPTRDSLLFFPKNAPLTGYSWKRLKRTADRQFAKLRSKGRAGIVSYCFFNFVFYTAGFLRQWPRVAPADPFLAPSVVVVCLRKFGRIFMSLYLANQVLKLPRLLAAVALTPVSKRVLMFVQERLRVSETFATVMLVGLMIALWLTLVSVPIVAEYTSLRRLVRLDRLIAFAPWTLEMPLTTLLA